MEDTGERDDNAGLKEGIVVAKGMNGLVIIIVCSTIMTE